ncbi:MAG: glycoside hydrolase family 65 protein [Bacteroidota bacterium]
MKQYLKQDDWCIIEEGFHQQHNQISESIFSIGNGRMGQRANFEEQYSGETLQGSYIAGVYYPDKTRVGWWKNGYPEYFAKVLNAPNWIGIDITIDGEVFDLAKCEVDDFVRTLNMKEGYLERSFEAKLVSGKIIKVKARRFCSMDNDEIGAIRYSITPLNFKGTLTLTPYVDGDIVNQDSNYDEKFWVGLDGLVDNDEAYLLTETRKTAFKVCTGMQFRVLRNGEVVESTAQQIKQEKYVACSVDIEGADGEEIIIEKYAGILTSQNHPEGTLMERCREKVQAACQQGFAALLAAHTAFWASKWAESDIVIEGDVAAQQGIRFNIFHLNQTYTGEDERLNIGPKGFTGEKYGGSTYWDTEAYCLPFFLATAEERVARNLLIYRYKHLQKAIENAEKLGFKDGAALYPMVTMNGEECHNEWEITFEEIHRNGAIAYAIYDYIRYTGDQDYLIKYGLEVLLGIARFWAQRFHFSERRGLYVMHGVTGPNEYENNVNNNWYTNTIAVWCLQYALEAIEHVRGKAPEQLEALAERVKFYELTETKEWKKIIDNTYFPYDEELGIFLQQDGYMDKEQRLASELGDEYPIWQNWSWDRILRSCFIKQADVLQGIYFFEERHDEATIRRNFEFYEKRTVHESSLSPCVHVVLAARLKMLEKAYTLYLRTARLDLDDYNNDTEDGLHITSMAGTWMAVVKGFGGMRVTEDGLQFDPLIPKEWAAFAFKIRYRGSILQIRINQQQVSIHNESDQAVELKVYDQAQHIAGGAQIIVENQRSTV